MTKRDVHVVPRGDEWAVVREQADRASSLHPTQREAEDAARETAASSAQTPARRRTAGRADVPREYPFAVSDEKPDEKPETRNGKLKASVVLAVTAVGTLTAWKSYSFAPEWFADALREAKDERRGVEGRGCRRREILFAVCAAESYVFEWVRDTVLKRDFKKLEKYFPFVSPERKPGVLRKLKEIPKKLASDHLVDGPLDCSRSEWRDFEELVREYRDGLVHADASRPETDGQPANEKPTPSMSKLDALPPGRAVEVVRVILRKLHSDTKTMPLPRWLS